MGLRFPLSIRINDGRVDRHVTAQASGLRFTKTAPGGFHSMSVSLDVDPELFPDLGPADRIWVYGPNGQTLFEGFLDNPGRSSGDLGVGFEISAMGTVVLASDQARSLIYIDRDLSAWTAYAKNITTVSADQADDPTDVDPDPGLLLQLNQGTTAATGSNARIGYPAISRTSMEVGAFRASYKSGVSSSNYGIDFVYSATGGSGTVALQTTTVTGVRASGRYVGDGTIPVGTTSIGLRMVRTGAATNIGGDDTWTWFDNIAVLGRRMNRTGVLSTGSAGMQSFDAVRSDWVVEDLIGRLFNVCDANACLVEAGSYLIDQLAFTDPVTGSDVLDALEVYEPDFLWEFLGSAQNGYVFNYRAWPTTARYEVSTRDGYEAPGADFDLCNRVTVAWVDVKGKDRTTVVTAASAPGILLPGDNPVPTVFAPSLLALEDAKRVRDAERVILPEVRGSAANALRAGQQALAAASDPPKAATVTVRRPIVDLLRGGWAMPYEVEPGYLCRVRETGDLLRVTEVEVDDEEGTATLTLGTPVLTEEQRLIKLAKARKAA